MGLTIKAPVQITLTLPENWQECKTPQELAYWLIARFDELAQTHDIEDIREDIASILNELEGHDERITTAQRAVDILDDFATRLGERVDGLELSRAAFAQELAGVSASVALLSEVQTVDVRGYQNYQLSVGYYGAKRFLIKANILEYINIILEEDIQDGDYLEFVIVGRVGSVNASFNSNSGATLLMSLDGNSVTRVYKTGDTSYHYTTSDLTE